MGLATNTISSHPRETIRCRGGDDEFSSHLPTPTSSYILNPLYYIGDGEMILEEETFEKFGYYPKDITVRQHKPILVTCNVCGKVRAILKRGVHYNSLCRKCGGVQNQKLNDKEWLFTQYWLNELSLLKIAKEIGSDASSVALAFKRLGIPTRTLMESHPRGEKHYLFGEQMPEETRWKIRENHPDFTGENHPQFGTHPSKETRAIMQAKKIGLYDGPKNPNWNGGISFDPYCTKFNNVLKEEIRDKFGRICFICSKTEEENGRKLDVHHVDYNKNQGCNGIRWLLAPLCMSCNGKANFNRSYWQNFIIEKMRKEEYLG